jgi:hypothetical protein
MSEKTKSCAGCKEKSIAVNEFYKNKTTEDGLSIYCKKCTKLNAKKYYQKKLLKKASEDTGVTIKDGLFPSNFVTLNKQSTEIHLKIAVIERLMLTINKELKELFEYKLTENIK